MGNQNDNIVLFPKQRKDLESKAFHAMDEKDYLDALKYFDQLIDHGVDDQAIHLGKLTSLIELGEEKDAEELCEELIAKKDENYFSYINLYATLLFQSHKHKAVAQLLEEALIAEDIPAHLKSQFEKLYSVNQPLVNEQIEQEERITIRELTEAFETNDSLAQWHLVNHLQNVDIEPYINLFKDMLKSPEVNPVIKTVIIGLLQAKSIDQEFIIEKFSIEMTIDPSIYPFKNDHPFRKAFRKAMESCEQENPTFCQLCEQLIDRYFYVLYPFTPKLSKLEPFKQAIILIVKSSLDGKKPTYDESDSKEIEGIVNQIIEVEKIYFSIIEE